MTYQAVDTTIFDAVIPAHLNNKRIPRTKSTNLNLTHAGTLIGAQLGWTALFIASRLIKHGGLGVRGVEGNYCRVGRDKISSTRRYTFSEHLSCVVTL